MITDSEAQEILERLTEAKKPVFLYDDDPDGVCAFLLLYRHLKKGQGIIVKSSPEVKAEQYLQKVKNLEPDLVVILDKPLVEREFLEKIKTDIIWIDHHEPQKDLPKHVHYYNPMKITLQQSSTTAQCWKIISQPEDVWLAAVGTIGDWTYVPKIMQQCRKIYPDLSDSKYKTAPDVLFNTHVGTLAKLIHFNLKGTTTDVYKSIKVLSRITDPREILSQTTPPGKFLYQKFKKMKQEYDKLKKKADRKVDGLFLVSIENNVKNSFSAELSNEMLYRHPKQIIVIGRISKDLVKASLRTQYPINLPGILHEALQGLEGYGGGHAQACGLCIAEEHFELFLERFKELSTKAIDLHRTAK